MTRDENMGLGEPMTGKANRRNTIRGVITKATKEVAREQKGKREETNMKMIIEKNGPLHIAIDDFVHNSRMKNKDSFLKNAAAIFLLEAGLITREQLEGEVITEHLDLMYGYLKKD